MSCLRTFCTGHTAWSLLGKGVTTTKESSAGITHPSWWLLRLSGHCTQDWRRDAAVFKALMSSLMLWLVTEAQCITYLRASVQKRVLQLNSYFQWATCSCSFPQKSLVLRFPAHEANSNKKCLQQHIALTDARWCERRRRRKGHRNISCF